MPTQTDRDKIKDQQEGTYLTAAGMSNAKEGVAAMHARPYVFVEARTTANTLSEFPCGTVPHASRLKKVGLQLAANVANDSTDYAVIKFFKRVAGTSTLIASWNTHTSAQGALTTAAPGIISSSATGLITNSDADIPANAGLTYSVTAGGVSQPITAQSVFTLWLEEV